MGTNHRVSSIRKYISIISLIITQLARSNCAQMSFEFSKNVKKYRTKYLLSKSINAVKSFKIFQIPSVARLSPSHVQST